jgi:hypothetical protein
MLQGVLQYVLQCVLQRDAVCCSAMQSRSAGRAHPSCKTVLQCVLQYVLQCMRQCQYLQCVLEHILWHLLDTLQKKIEGCSKEPGAPNGVVCTHFSAHHIFCEENILLYLRNILQKNGSKGVVKCKARVVIYTHSCMTLIFL